MKNKLLMLGTAATMALATAAPSFAGPMKEGAGLVGVTTATVVDVPEGIVLDATYRVPKKYWQTLARNFGDENGFGQNVAGAVIGVPFGVVFGIPYGAVHGLYHAWNHAWDKPFATESYYVTEEK